jgi:hypothetical protein
MPDQDPDERFVSEGNPEEAQRDLLEVDPEAPPAKPNEDRPAPQQPAKDQGDALSEDLEN